MFRMLNSAALVLAWGHLMAGEPDARALEHGRRQVEQMLRDRPEMTRYPSGSGFLQLSASDPQVRWAIRKFAGEDTGFLVYWEPKPPMDVNTAEHNSHGPSDRAVIRVAKVGFPITVTRENAFDVMWSGAVFELLNITRHERFDKLAERAWKKEIDQQSYILGMAEVEFEALRQLQAYASATWVPWAATASARMDRSVWWLGLPSTFEEWIDRYQNKNAYPWHPYGIYYDELTGTGK